MANKTATAKLKLSYTSPFGVAIALPEMTFACPYEAHSVSGIDVPALTNSGASFDVPFGPVDEATCVVIVNRLAAPLDVKINGAADASHSIAADSCMMFALTAVGSTEITEIALVTTDTQGSEVGVIECLVFGDPS